MKELNFPTHNVFLCYHGCPDCEGEDERQSLDSVTDIGTAVCPDCGEDLELKDYVAVMTETDQ